MDRETVNTRERHGNNGRDYEPLYPYPQHSTAVASDPHQLSGVAELMIAGGLGVAMYMAPNIKDFVQRKFQSIKARTIILRNLLCQTNITSKLRMLYRLRSKGSLVRVIATLLPSQLYAPTRRIYIPDWRAQLDAAAGHSGLILPLINSRRDDMPTENEVGDGCIEAFEMGSDIVSVSDDEISEDDGSATSTPEGWTKEQQKRLTAQFNPTINTSPDDNIISFARCSTPKGSTQNLAFESQITHIGSNYGSNPKLNEDQTTEISELKKIIGGLVLQINTLSESIMASRNQNLTTAEISTGSSQSLDQPLSSTVPPPPSLALPLAPKILTTTPAGPPPPPPPPPPPMPPMPAMANKPLVIVRKGNQDKLIQKKSQVSLSDVLKELPNAKLRRVERSPGGTPIKPLLKLPKDNAQLDMADQLADVLKKRFASMHSPAYDTDTDKENANGSDDSFEDSPISSKPIPTPAKRSLFPARVSPMKRSSIEKNNENRPTFGQHLLKKRTNVEVGFGKSTNGSPLREQNSSVN